VLPLPFQDAGFSIVSSRYAFHHFPDPFAVLVEMRRVCRPGGHLVVADAAPAASKADAYNAMERLRDPSHVRALPLEEHCRFFERAGLDGPRVELYRLEGELDDLLRRSFPNPGDAGRLREIFEQSLENDALDMAVRRSDGKILFGYPI